MSGNKAIFKKLLPYVVALVCFTALPMAYFAPQFSGEKIPMPDMIHYDGMSKEIVDHQKEYGEDPQWTGTLFSGMPATLINMQHKSSFLRVIVFNIFDFLGRPTSLIFAAQLCFFVMLLFFRVNPWVAIIPSIAYGFSTYFFLIIGAGHITKIFAMAYAPLMIGSMWYTFRGKMYLGAALTALFASLEIAANHPQIAYYFFFVLVAMWISEGIYAYREKLLPRFAKVTGLLAIAAILAVGSNLSMLWQVNKYGKVSMRGGSELVEEQTGKKNRGLDLEYATAWSYGKTESFNMFIPNFMGGASDVGFSKDGDVAQALEKYGERDLAPRLPGYWGDQPGTAGPTYLGAVVVFLFVLGMMLLRGREKWWVLGVTVLALLLSWGRNFMWFTELFYNFVPGYNKFRTVAMILVIVQWSVPFLAALVLDKIWKGEITKGAVQKKALHALYITGGVAVFFLLFGGVLFDFIAPSDSRMGLPQDVLSAMWVERATMLRMDSLRSLIFVGLAAGVVILFVKKLIGKKVFWLSFLVLVCVDLIPVNLRFLPQSKFVDAGVVAIKPESVDLEIMKDKTLGYRVLNTSVSTYDDAKTSYFHRSVGGYHGAKIQRYQDVIERYLSKGDWNVLNMLNTKYMIGWVDREQQKKGFQQNHDANGAAWFVESVIEADGANEEITLLGEIDTKREAVVDRRFMGALDGVALEVDSLSGDRFIELIEYRANYLKYDYFAPQQSVVIFSEIFYDGGWRAFVDGVEQPHFRANYILRGMVLPEGDHTVEFRYRASGFREISTITFIFSLSIVLWLSGCVVVNYVRRREGGATKQDNI